MSKEKEGSGKVTDIIKIGIGVIVVAGTLAKLLWGKNAKERKAREIIYACASIEVDRTYSDSETLVRQAMMSNITEFFGISAKDIDFERIINTSIVFYAEAKKKSGSIWDRIIFPICRTMPIFNEFAVMTAALGKGYIIALSNLLKSNTKIDEDSIIEELNKEADNIDFTAIRSELEKNKNNYSKEVKEKIKKDIEEIIEQTKSH